MGISMKTWRIQWRYEDLVVEIFYVVMEILMEIRISRCDTTP
jgi:hypothetical protein